MSAEDFDRCTPSEFSKVMEQWQLRREESERSGWERARFIATCCLQPYSRKTLRPADVARFPWEESKVEKGHGSLERMRELEARLKEAEKKGRPEKKEAK